MPWKNPITAVLVIAYLVYCIWIYALSGLSFWMRLIADNLVMILVLVLIVLIQTDEMKK
jgi:hypothetical protein